MGWRFAASPRFSTCASRKTAMASSSSPSNTLEVSRRHINNNKISPHTLISIQITVRYTTVPTLSYISSLKRHIQETKPDNYQLVLRWEQILVESSNEAAESQQGKFSAVEKTTRENYFYIPLFIGTHSVVHHNMTHTVLTNNRHPYGYKRSDDRPELRGEDYCQHCLCSPCLVTSPPDYLRGRCNAHPANNEKRHRLYRLFWKTLRDVGVWKDEEYLLRKETRTSRYDKREIIPSCIIEVKKNNSYYYS